MALGWVFRSSSITSRSVKATEQGMATASSAARAKKQTGKSTVLPMRSKTRSPAAMPRLAQTRGRAKNRPRHVRVAVTARDTFLINRQRSLMRRLCRSTQHICRQIEILGAGGRRRKVNQGIIEIG
jgi:hypothetical protein